MKQSWDCVILTLGIPMQVRLYFYTALWAVKNKSQSVFWHSYIDFCPEHWYQVTLCVIWFTRLIVSYLYFHDSSIILQADSKSWSEVIPLNLLTPPASIIYNANIYIYQKLCQVVIHTCSWHLQWQNWWLGVTKQKSMLNSMLVNKDFLTWLLIGWRLCCQPIRCQVWKSLFTNMDFNMEIS